MPQISQEELDRLVQLLSSANAQALTGQGNAQKVGARAVAASIEESRIRLVAVMQSLIRHGGKDALKLPRRESFDSALLQSEKAQMAAQMLRDAALAVKEMEEERYGKGVDGFWEIVYDWGEAYAQEAGLQGEEDTYDLSKLPPV